MQELNMKIAKTPLGNAIEELDALKEELADVINDKSFDKLNN